MTRRSFTRCLHRQLPTRRGPSQTGHHCLRRSISLFTSQLGAQPGDVLSSPTSPTISHHPPSPVPPPSPAPRDPPRQLHQEVPQTPDPFALVSSDLARLRSSLLPLLRSGHPALSEIAEYYFLHPSKQIRPLLVLLLAQATNGLGSRWGEKLDESTSWGSWKTDWLDVPLTRPDVLNDWNPHLPACTREFKKVFEADTRWERRTKGGGEQGEQLGSSSPAQTTTTNILHTPPLILPTQLRLAQIIEMIHTASLLHDDVIDGSPLRRGHPSAPSAFGKKLSVLGGNFILGRASGALARLGDMEVTELIASILANLVDGEILQLRRVVKGSEKVGSEGEEKVETRAKTRQDAWNVYLQKTYLKTASLMAKAARATVVLGGCKEGDMVREIAYAYGRNLGIAFQLVDDVLDYESATGTTNTTTTTTTTTATALGKPGGADLQLGLATGPALYAWEEHEEMRELIERKFGNDGDVERARDYIRRSSGVQRTRVLAQEYADKAKEVIQSLPDSEAKAALEALTERVMRRKS